MAVKKLNGKLYLDDSEKPLEENLAGMFIQF
jgi:E3 SUMO-protein ligase RanBP2